jgi:hypothetical protein
MANQNLLTYGLKLTQLKQDYYAPTLVFKGTTTPAESIYCFLSRVDSWPIDPNTNQEVPAIPTQDQQYIKNVFKNMFVAKQITSNNMTPVTQRFDWTSGTTYDYYRDDVDMFARDSSGLLVKTFYVRNRYDQVFKCLWNNNGQPSTDEPYFQPGTYNTNNVFVSGIDKYKWKYMYTIDIGSKTKFMDSTWIPVPLGTNTPNPLTTAGIGNIDVINITNQGSGYDPANAAITIRVTGSGNTAQTTATYTSVVGGAIQDITVINPGANYTSANVIITSANTQKGSGATAIAPVSPIGGHGYDPVSELGCNHIMYAVEFNGKETLDGIDYVPTLDANGNGITYRQIGLIFNPMAQSTYPNFANNSIYDLSTRITVAGGVGGLFVSDETVTQIDNTAGSSTQGQQVFSGTVLSFNATTNVLKLINTLGTPILNGTISGQSSGATRTVLAVNNPNFINFSGYIAYIENRTGVQRSDDGIEQFKFVLGY